MADHKLNLYNVSLGGQGYLLVNTPDSPARTVDQAPIYGNRFASGDRDYTDLSFWWFWAQTDWSGGIKDVTAWEDDAKHYYSTNIDAYSKYGSIKLASGLLELEEFTGVNIYCGCYGRLGGTNTHFIGVQGGAGVKPIVYKSTNQTDWTNISNSQLTTVPDKIYWVKTINNLLWVGLKDDGGANSVLSYNGSAWTDYSAAITAAMTGAVDEATGIAYISTDIYVAIDGSTNVSIMKYNGAAWSEIATWTDETTIYDIINYQGDIYYLKGKSSGLLELRVWDVSASSDALIQEFRVGTMYKYYGSNKYLQTLGGKLIITIPNDEIWEYNTTTMTRIWERDDTKEAIGREAIGYLQRGATLHDNKIFWTNLMYDGSFFFNTKKEYADNSDYRLYPIYSDQLTMKWKGSDDETKLYRDYNYKGTANKNFLVMNSLESVSTIDKLFYSGTVLFDKLVSGQKITIDYSIDGMATWTELGNASYTADGGTITSKTLYFPENTRSQKIWIRIDLEGSGSNTPSVNDFSAAYLPTPDYRQRWTVQVSCFNHIMLLDGKTKDTKRGNELRNLLKTAWWTKNSIEFQDVDFAETAINDGSDLTASNTTVTVDSTANFAEQGRIRIETEEILYTGKTKTTFTGCTRGARGTTAATHADDTVVNTSYDVLITNYVEKNPVSPKAQIGESLVTLELREI